MVKPSKAAHPKVETASERVSRSKSAVLATTFELMSEAGIASVSVDEVSRRSGVAKTTIYRHWPSRSALLLDACAKLRSQPRIPETGGLKGDLLAHAASIAQQLKSARWPMILPSIIDAAERDPDVAKLLAQLQDGFAYPYAAIIESAKKRGEVPARATGLDAAALVSGPLFFRRWHSRQSIDDEFVKLIVERAVESLKAK